MWLFSSNSSTEESEILVDRSPRIYEVEPDSNIDKSHHGPPIKDGLILKASPLEKSHDQPNCKYYLNPWPSYRTPSAGDAYKAYCLGAAVAHPEPRRLSIRHEDGQSLAGDPLDDPHPDPPLRLPNKSWLPASTYVRQPLATMYDDDEESDWRNPPVKVLMPEWGGVWGNGGDQPTVTWLGHAGVLVQIPWKGKEREGMCGVIFDPIFSYRCSPSQYVGPARHQDPPCTVSLLPDIHVCCISHDHYDHLDYYTIIDLWKYHQRTIHFFVPMGLKKWFLDCGIPSERITVLDWWHERILTFNQSSQTSRGSSPTPEEEEEEDSKIIFEGKDLSLKIAFTPAQHRSGRGVLDHMTTLWGSWCVGVVEDSDRAKAFQRGMKDAWRGFKVFFGGDTGFRYATADVDDEDAVCPAFEMISQHYSPFNLSLLPLSTGSSLPFLRTVLSLSLDQYTLTSSLHCSPRDSLEIHKILKSERSVGIHWGTFCDLDEARATRVEFGRARRDLGVSGVWDGESLNTREERKGQLEIQEDRSARGEEGFMKGEEVGRFVVCEIGETLVVP